MTKSPKERLTELIGELREFRFCGPSDDPDEQTSVTSSYLYLLVQLKRLASRFLPDAEATRLNAIEVDINDLMTAFAAKAEVDAILHDIEAVLEGVDENSFTVASRAWIIAPELVDRIGGEDSTKVDVQFLGRMCREINSCYAHGNIVATALLMRAVLNYVPPLFGHETFPQVVANIGRSLKDSFDHLESGLRKIADFHTHRRIGPAESYPSVAQVEPFKPQFELLLQQVVSRVHTS